MGSGGVAIAALPTVICLKVPFSDGLGGVIRLGLHFVISHSKTNISENVREEYISQERNMYNRLYKDLQVIVPLDFLKSATL